MEHPLTITAALEALAAGKTTSLEITDRALEAADAHDDAVGVFVSRFADAARVAAREADQARAKGDERPLLGIPIGIKDIITTIEGETTAQSDAHDRSAMHGDAAVVRRLRDAGAVIVGKTTTLEFAFGAPDPEKPYPIPRNPWSLAHWAGGSSSGSASGVVADMMLGAVGTDTGASVRMPSALCGITGLKPTFGLVPKSGVVPLGYTLDHPGPMARSAEDCALMLGVMTGADATDVASTSNGMVDNVRLASGRLDGLRIGVDRLSRFAGTYEDPALGPLIDAMVRQFEELGAIVVDVEIPHYAAAAAATVLTVLAEGFTYHRPDLRERWADFGASTRIGLAAGAYVSAADYVQAQRVRRLAKGAVGRLFTEVDLILTPTVGRAAPLIDDVDAYLGTLFEGRDFAHHTAYWNAVGNPALSLPIGFNAEGLPLAGQLVGRPFEDRLVLHAGRSWQHSTDWHLREPVIPSDFAAGTATSVAAEAHDQPLADQLLAMHGVDAGADATSVRGAWDLVRHNAELVHTTPGARYADPLLTFRAEDAGENES